VHSKYYIIVSTFNQKSISDQKHNDIAQTHGRCVHFVYFPYCLEKFIHCWSSDVILHADCAVKSLTFLAYLGSIDFPPTGSPITQGAKGKIRSIQQNAWTFDFPLRYLWSEGPIPCVFFFSYIVESQSPCCMLQLYHLAGGGPYLLCKFLDR